jgi:hypothetical protein
MVSVEDIVKIVPCPGDITESNLADFRLKWVVKFPKWGRKLIANGFPLQKIRAGAQSPQRTTTATKAGWKKLCELRGSL